MSKISAAKSKRLAIDWGVRHDAKASGKSVGSRRCLVIAAGLATISGTSSALAQSTFGGLGQLANYADSLAFGISANGSVVVGYTFGSNSAISSRPISWSGNNVTDLGALPSANYGEAYAVSADGSVIVGESGGKAFRWTNGTMTDLGIKSSLNAQNIGAGTNTAYGVSSDGSVVVGIFNTLAQDTALNWIYHGFRWSNGTAIDLGTLGGNGSNARATSADGSVVVGWSDVSMSNIGLTHAFRWSSGVMTDLGSLAGSSGNSQANGVSADGSVVVGISDTSIGNPQRAFRWTNSGGMVDLGTLGGPASVANAVSADGNVVVGAAQTSSGAMLAARWTQATHFQSIASWLSTAGVTVPSTWTLSQATATNQDGSVVVGNGVFGGNSAAWIARVNSTPTPTPTPTPASTSTSTPTPGSGIIFPSIFNVSIADAAVRGGAGESTASLALFGAHRRSLLDSGLARSDVHGVCAWAMADENSSNDSRAALLETGVCKDIGHVRVGLGVGQSWSQQDWALGGSGRYHGQYVVAEVAKSFVNGIEASVTGLYGRFNTTFQRNYQNGALIDTSRGNPDTDSYAVRLRWDWKDVAQVATFGLSPYVTYTWADTRVDAYSETGGGFPVAFQDSKLQSDDVRVGVAGKTAISAQTALRLGLEAVSDRCHGSGQTAQVIGLYSLSIDSRSSQRSWGRLTADVDHRLSNESLVTIGANAGSSSGNMNSGSGGTSWGVTVEYRAQF